MEFDELITPFYRQGKMESHDLLDLTGTSEGFSSSTPYDSESTSVSKQSAREKPTAHTPSSKQSKRRAASSRQAQRDTVAQRDTKPQVKKALLSDIIGDQMTTSLMSSTKDFETMDILERLKHQAGGAQAMALGTQGKATTLTASVTIQAVTMATDSSEIVEAIHDREKSVPTKKHKDLHTFTLHDIAAVSALNCLVERYGRVSHMGILDPSYTFFLSKDRQAALYYKVKNYTAIVGGDPLCSLERYDSILKEFRQLRRQHGWGIAFLGATDSFLPYAKGKKWVTMRFGTERVLNPLNNPVAQEREGKRIITQTKQLLNPDRGGLSVHVYVPAQGRDDLLEQQLRHIYDSWRDHRNQSPQPQAYMTVFDPFAIPGLMTYIYTMNRDGQCNGFAALRKIGASKGYHIDPYCALPTAPKGVTDLLIFSAMSLLQRAGIGYLSLGFEPEIELGEVTALSRPTTAITKSFYRRAFKHLPIGGKKAYHDKFRPDPVLESGLYLIYPEGAPSIQHAMATLHIANIKVRGLLQRELLGSLGGRGLRKVKQGPAVEKKVASGEGETS
ncbi:hypothetical protein PV05_06930 [Exophiala xenobiotica]|uniref:Phosphatidylglycerol lysyltransferase C-terminal domain-containing protein n=1 Tax=Exophiala xenobiotica TaxID=348802 RepID=A0A0D2F3W8_9EURO|nr:uncharacterized protein PV05_06930 [Exophiala xenobiotica]KIW54579.1 hypothetical protein PV05_06930 [Exophiala xenobiotica]